MREIQASVITDAVKRLCIDANCHLTDDVKNCISCAYSEESWPGAKEILGRIIENYEIADVREEIGYSGAYAAARRVAPDLSIVLETTAISDRPDTEPHRRVADVGGGAAISVADRSTIYDREIVDFALALGKEKGIKAQSKRYVSGGNDAGHIHRVLDGIKVLAVSVPTRYLHSPACVARIDDYEAVRDLASAIIKTYKRRDI